MGDVTGEGMSGGRQRRRHEWGRHWRMFEWGDVTGEGMSWGRHWRMYEWGTSEEKA